MASELMLYCVEGGVGNDAYVSGKSYPADEVLSNMHFRENENQVSVWKRCADGIEIVSLERYLGKFDYALIEA
ncbi:TPA: hypothetical protein GFX84_06125 [Escherichia coli]|uniref:hypothetical protein n=1 Tax=Escherichia coli TaxID=562 RepID=UPI0017D77CEA|nr:hypothetical protein [Escherichia coli]MCH4705991.1 hypothetical protein [Escherichia coli]HAH3639776.1 hypothetical protein [Escherichia coli]HCJ5618390.1 hypothetical protein [Escherichia coli]